MRKGYCRWSVFAEQATKGWPVVKCRLEIYLGDDLVTTAKFTIKGGKSNKKSDDE